MSRDTKASDETFEVAFNAAIDRIVAGRPQHPDLIADAQEGRLVLSKVNVAKEAGRSRTKLYECPCVLERIDAMGGRPQTTSQDVIGDLRIQNEQLRREKQQALDAAAAMLLRMRNLERRTDQAVRRARRQASRPDPNKVVGTVVPFPTGDGEAD